MVADKGLSEDVADRIGQYVGLKGGSRLWIRLTTGAGYELLEKLESDSALMGVASAKQGLADMRSPL